MFVHQSAFDREKHLYQNQAFVELVKDAIRFFNGTPIYSLPLAEKFSGAGVYALYYTGSYSLYQPYAQANRLGYNQPIYVGKAVPKGWRQARVAPTEAHESTELCHRLREHTRSLQNVADLDCGDFACRFVIFTGESSDMIGTIEAALIKLHQPLWNSCVDGFGNHDPGSGRYEQARSDWDVLHPGRAWAERLNGVPKTKAQIETAITEYFQTIKPSFSPL